MKNFKEFLNEASLSRVYDMMSKHDTGMISGYRDERTREENKNMDRKILVYLKSKGYSLTRVKGSYIENFGSDTAKEVSEDSFFVVDINNTGRLKSELFKLGVLADQDSIMFIEKGTESAVLIGTSKREESYPGWNKQVKVGQGRYGKASGEFFSRVRGRQMAFESIETAGSYFGKMGESILAKEVQDELNEIDLK